MVSQKCGEESTWQEVGRWYHGTESLNRSAEKEPLGLALVVIVGIQESGFSLKGAESRFQGVDSEMEFRLLFQKV